MDSKFNAIRPRTEEFRDLPSEFGADIHVGGGIGALHHRCRRSKWLSRLCKAGVRTCLDDWYRPF